MTADADEPAVYDECANGCSVGAKHERCVVALNRVSLALACIRQQFENQLGSHLDGVFECAVNRTLVGEKAVHAPGRFTVRLASFQCQSHVNSPDDKYVILQLNFTYRFGR
jgi:hypothetical protein